MRKVTITIPTQAGTTTTTGLACNFLVGPSKNRLRVVLNSHNREFSITHRESGQVIGYYGELRTRHYVSNPYARTPHPREFALMKINEIIDRIGEDKFWAVINLAPKLNK